MRTSSISAETSFCSAAVFMYYYIFNKTKSSAEEHRGSWRMDWMDGNKFF